MPTQPDGSRRPGGLARGAAAILALAAAAWLAPGTMGRAAPQAGQPSAAPAIDPRVILSQGSLPVVREHRYRMSAKVRPLLLFWMSKDNVGGARIRWRRGGQDERGYDMLIGSDPKRAPRDLNRWGFILEESRGRDTLVVGVMKRSDSDSLEAAKADVAEEGKQGYFWKMIQGTADGSHVTATVTLTSVATDYSYRQLDSLLEALVRFPGPPRVRTTAIPPGGRPGFLTALADLIHETVDTVARTGRPPARAALPYAYYGHQYDLVRRGAQVKTNAAYGGRTYPRVVDASFEVRHRGSDWSQSFTLALGVDGDLAGVPVFVSYQPKWWFKADMVLDERETF